MRYLIVCDELEWAGHHAYQGEIWDGADLPLEQSPWIVTDGFAVPIEEEQQQSAGAPSGGQPADPGDGEDEE